MLGGMEVGWAGTITFLFTDLEGSTRLWEQFPDGMKDALKRHDAIQPRRTLGPVYAAFTEGFATVDLLEARDLLSAVEPGRSSPP